MTQSVTLKGKKFKLGTIFRKGKFFIQRRISPVTKKLAVEYAVFRKTELGSLKIGVFETKPQAIAFTRKASKAQRLANKAFQKSKELARQAGGEFKRGAGLLFRVVEKETRPGRSRTKKRKARKKKKVKR